MTTNSNQAIPESRDVVTGDPLSPARPDRSSRLLASHPVVITRDPDTAQAGISRYLWPQQLRVVDDPAAEGWRFRARLHHHDLGNGMALAYLTYGQAEVVSTLRATPGRDAAILVHLPIAGDVEVWAGREHAHATGPTAVVIHPGQVTLTRWAPGAEHLIVVIPTALVEECLRQVTGEALPTPRFGLAQNLGAWTRLARAIADNIDTGVLTEPFAVCHAQRLLAAGLLSAASHNHSARLHDTTAGYDPPVRAAMAWIHAHYTEPVGTRDIARAVGMKPRTLQRYFAAQVGMGPVEYLRRVRLVHARDELLAASATRTTTVTALAHDTGYASRTWFSELYQRTYGELPIDTLRRRR